MVSRRGRRNGLFSRFIGNPLHQVFGFGKNSVGAVTNTVKGVVGKGVNGLNTVARSVTRRADKIVSGVVSGKSRRNRRGRRNTRKSRR